MKINTSTLISLSLLVAPIGVVNAQSNLHVAAGSEVTVEPTTTIYVGGIISGDGVVTLNADASGYAQLVQGSTSSNTGNVTVEKYLDNTNPGWRNFYFPFAGSYSDIDFNSSLAFINETNDQGIAARHNFFKWNAADAGSGVATGWESVASNDVVTTSAMVYTDNSNSIHTFNQTISTTGITNNGNVSFTLVNTLDPNYSGSTPSDGTGWNYIGNPYPTNISLSALFALASFPTYEAIHVLDQKNGGQYIALLESGVAINYNTGSGSSTAITHIEPMQGFWVKTDANATLTLDNSIRDSEGTAGNYMKTDYDLFRLNLQSQDGLLDQIVVYFAPNATDGYDLDLEALKVYASSPVPAIAAMDKDNHRVSITALEKNNNETIIPLEIGSHVDGTPHVLSLIDSDLPSNYDVYLEDTQNNTLVNLRVSTSTIVPSAATRSGRYQLRVSASGISVEENENSNVNFTAWASNDLVHVTTPSNFSGNAELLDVSGRLISTVAVNNTSEFTMTSSSAAGIYILRLVNENGLVVGSEKIIL